MKSHQKIMREKIALQETESSLFGPYWQNIDVDINKAVFIIGADYPFL